MATGYRADGGRCPIAHALRWFMSATAWLTAAVVVSLLSLLIATRIPRVWAF